MDKKPVPKPRTIFRIEKPVPAPRSLHSPVRTRSPSESSMSEKSDESRSSDFFKNLSSSSRQLKEGLSEKVTTKGRALISSSRNASIRLEKSMKNMLTKRLTALLPNEIDEVDKSTDAVTEDRCTSMPTGREIFDSITFYSPLHVNLKKSMKNVEDLSKIRYSPPPPIYPPPPPPTDDCTYDEVQSIMSNNSSRYDTLSSTFSERIEADFGDTFDSRRSRTTESDSSGRSSSTSNITNVTKDEADKRLYRSDSWNFYDSTKTEAVNDILQPNMSLIEEIEDTLNKNRLSNDSAQSNMSVANTLYENWMPPKLQSNSTSSGSRSACTKSVILEFDPIASSESEDSHSFYKDNNDMTLLETLLAASATDSSQSSGSVCESVEDIEEPEEVLVNPPPPPRRFDSLPKHDYDEVEMEPVEVLDKVSNKNPALLPKLVHLSKKKKPAVPPRIFSETINEEGTSEPLYATLDYNRLTETSPSKSTEDRKNSVIQKLKKLGQSSSSGLNLRWRLPRQKDQANESIDTQKKKTTKEKMTRPKVAVSRNPPTYRGTLYKCGTGIERAKELVSRYAVLAEQMISFYTDSNMTSCKETIQLSTAQSVHLLQDVKNVDGETVYCIAISGEGKSEFHLLYAKSIMERRMWAQKILETVVPVFLPKYTSEFTLAGWAYLKEGVTRPWKQAWLLLQQRTLFYVYHILTNNYSTLERGNLESIDLRKARCIVVREEDGPIADSENVPVVVVDTGREGALHLTIPGLRGVPTWKHALYQAATNCGPALEQQQLTQDNVPVILDKCINFIYAHGILTEGIYRRSGSSSAVARLLDALRRDAWATQITRSSYSEHDVATVLRRFLRELPEPLFPQDIYGRICEITDSENEEGKVEAYRNCLQKLNTVGSATLKSILGHLQCICQKSEKNLMNVENISAIWGPTLMHANDSTGEWNIRDTRVLGDLIRLYPEIYQLSKEDLAKEAKMLQVLEMHSNTNNGLWSAPSGDLKIWIYINSKDDECVNVTVGPHKTAFDVCSELASKTKFAAYELCLEEYCLHGSLERPLHHTEIVLEVVARWGYWDSEDRKNNVLILKKDKLYKELVPLVKPPMAVFGELKFADTRSKSFKTYPFEFSQAKLSCYKDKVCSNKLHEWKIEDIVWYLGHESKRNPQMGWSITFITKNNKPTRCKENPYFGYTVAGASKEEQYRWLAAMLFGQYQQNLRPPVNLMDNN